MSPALAADASSIIGDDPRSHPSFDPSLFPLANGGAPPAGSMDPRNDQIVMAFLAAYYSINVRWMQLRTIRSQPESAVQPHQERAALQAIESALRQRDELEDRWAPHGIIAEPIMEDGIALDVLFTFGSVNASGRFRAQPIVSTANLPFQVPEKSRRRGLKPPGPLPSGATTIFPCAD